MFAIDQFPEEKKYIKEELSIQLNPATHTKKACLIHPLGMLCLQRIARPNRPKIQRTQILKCCALFSYVVSQFTQAAISVNQLTIHLGKI